jgi:Transglutaminase-like superfamily
MLARTKSFSSQVARVVIRAGRLLYRDRREAIIVARMAGWVLLVSVGAKVLPLPRLLEIATPRPRSSPDIASAETESGMARLVDALLGINLFVFKPVCWKRAIVLHRYLRLRGIETRVVFGVRCPGEQLLAGHAWIEAGNKPLLEREIPDYVVTYSFPN